MSLTDSENSRTSRVILPNSSGTANQACEEKKCSLHTHLRDLMRCEILAYEFRLGEREGAVRSPGRWACSKYGWGDGRGGRACRGPFRRSCGRIYSPRRNRHVS